MLSDLKFLGPHDSKERVLGDVVRIVRAVRPLVVTSVFVGGPGDGHGNHQVAGLMAKEVFEAAALEASGPRLPTLKADSPLTTEWKPDLLQGVLVIKAEAADGSPLMAIPNYARTNRAGRSTVWIRDGKSTDPPSSP